jgi:Ca-activated chloride channel family protein
MEKKINRRSLLAVVGLMLLTGAMMGIAARSDRAGKQASNSGNDVIRVQEGTIAINAHLVQDKVLRGSEGKVTLALTLSASEAGGSQREAKQAVDLVVVLDRSGSMNGRKIQDARQAVLSLIETLSAEDRLGIVTYSNFAEPLSGLEPMTETHRSMLAGLVREIRPGGGTNLGGGLEAGLALFAAHPMDARHRKLVLISDGLANHGVTDPHALGRMAAAGLSKDWVVSTVGVGSDFNEHLMTTLADYGGGTYTYMEDGAAFAAVFLQEYHHTAATAATGMTVSVPLKHGLQLIDAGGYPIDARDGLARFNPGSLRFGQRRTVYLTFKVPTTVSGSVSIQGLQLGFQNRDGYVSTQLTNALTIACVENPEEVMASIHKESWAAQVVQEDFGRLKAAVADALREGDQEQAREHIASYRKEKATINRVVASPKVSVNLDEDVKALGAMVEDTFAGSRESVMSKQKKNAKTLQYESYQKRRDKN